MMADYEYAFVTALVQKLKEKIKVGVSAKIFDDELKVELFREHEVDFTFNVKCIAERILHGYDSDICANEITTAYRRKVLVSYFY